MKSILLKHGSRNTYYENQIREENLIFHIFKVFQVFEVFQVMYKLCTIAKQGLEPVKNVGALC